MLRSPSASLILLVVLLKKDETKHLQSGAVAASNAEIDAKLASKEPLHKTKLLDKNNIALEVAMPLLKKLLYQQSC